MRREGTHFIGFSSGGARASHGFVYIAVTDNHQASEGSASLNTVPNTEPWEELCKKFGFTGTGALRIFAQLKTL
jgi:hypothetical protein